MSITPLLFRRVALFGLGWIAAECFLFWLAAGAVGVLPVLAFVTLKDWADRRAPGSSAQDVAGRAFGALMGIRDAFIFPLSPPPIPELGTSSGFNFRLQDRAGLGRDALLAARKP